MILASRFHVNKNSIFFKECEELCDASRKLRNTCLYYIRKHYFETNTLYLEIDNKKQYLFNYAHLYHHFKENENFRTTRYINTKILKYVYRMVNNEFSSFYGAVKSYNKNPSKFLGKPKIPSYTKSKYITVVNKEAISFKEKGYMKIASSNIKIPLGEIKREQIKEIRIKPLSSGYDLIVIYEYENGVITPTKEEVTKIAGLDIGLNNLATITSNDQSIVPIIINGRPLKSINQYTNKKVSEIKTSLPKGIKSSKVILETWQKRHFKIRDYMHKSSNYIINWLLENKIDCLVVGSNKNWKQEINIGKRNNQNFVSIPFDMFKHQLKYKCEINGILYIEREESYTSKCSFLDLEDINKHEIYKGKRIKRGLFKTGNEIINADVNGAYNIIRKEFGNNIFGNTNLYQRHPVKVTSKICY